MDADGNVMLADFGVTAAMEPRPTSPKAGVPPSPTTYDPSVVSCLPVFRGLCSWALISGKRRAALCRFTVGQLVCVCLHVLLCAMLTGATQDAGGTQARTQRLVLPVTVK